MRRAISIAGAPGLSIWASLAALGSFLAGGSAGGRIGRRFAAHRGKLLAAGLATQILPLLIAVAVAAGDDPAGAAARYTLIGLLAAAMGTQNATVRRLGVAELTTTVLTMTLTGIAADSALAGGTGSNLGRRSLALGAMLLGGLVGAVLALRVDTVAPLAAAAGVLTLVGLAAQRLSRSRAAWTLVEPRRAR